MIPEGMKEKFELYRKWFRTLLRKEFINLPQEYQKRFLLLLDNLKKDCEKYYEEHKSIKEKTIKITILTVVEVAVDEHFVVTGKSSDCEDEIIITYPIDMKAPAVGDVCNFTMFSIDGIVWYSSKEELITGRIK